MNYRIVSDSSSNVFTVPGAPYATVPMKIIAGDREFTDTPALDLKDMVTYLKSYKGKSGSSCPNVQDWLDAFEGADHIFCTTISGGLSGSYNSAMQAAEVYMDANPGARIHVFDTRSAGPQQAFLNEKLAELIAQGLQFDAIVAQATEYHNSTHILFCLESLTNLARNGRINPAVAKIAGAIGMRVCGDVKSGQITPVHKPRGAKKATAILAEMMKERGFYDGAQLRIAHCFGETPAQALADAIRAEFPNARIHLEPTTALCSFYAEAGGLMIGFEGAFNTENHL